MKAGPMLAAFLGFAGGVVIVVMTLILEVWARDIPMRGGLLQLQLDSVAVWVLETLPFLLGAAAWAIAMAGTSRPHTSAPSLLVPAPSAPPPTATPPAPPPVPEGLASGTTAMAPPTAAPPPVPASLQGTQMLHSGNPDQRVKALHELVRVLKDNAARATAESRAKSTYLANMSHELRTPLNAIIGYAELLAESATGASAALEPDLRRVGLAGRQLVGLVNDILDLSKLEVGALALVLEDVDLAQVADEVRIAIAPLAAANDNTFSIRIAPGARMARGDHQRIRQILVNLLGNAFKFTDGGRVTLSVQATALGSGSWIALRVEDTGMGMDPDVLETIFDEYSQGRRSPKDQVGTGLGLAISRKLAELMGGRLEATSREGVGSEFTLTLPPSRVAEEAVPARSTVPLNERLSGMSLSVVDHDPSAVSLARYLASAGMMVERLSDSASAVAMSRSRPPDIGILDAQVSGVWPAVDAWVAAGVKVVVLSLKDEDVEAALQAGVTAFLTRPVDRKLVLATLERCLEEV